MLPNKNKKAVIFIPGFGGTAEMWHHQIHHLKDLAESKTLIVSQDSLNGMVQAVLNTMPDTFSIVGHSLGA